MMSRRRERLMTFVSGRRWQILWAIGFLIPVLWTIRLFVGTPAVVEPSRDTTYLTGSTLEDGSLDFSAALWHHCNTPIDDDQNAAILLRELPDPVSVDGFLLQAAEQHRATSESARLILDGESRHRGNYLWHFAGEQGRRSVQQPWTRDEFPLMAEMIDRDADYINDWKRAIARPGMAKPTGTTLDELRWFVLRGAARVLAQGMLYAGEGRWDLAVDNFAAIDAAADHLCRLQCGWIAEYGLSMRVDLTRFLIRMLRSSEEPDERLDAYVRRRCQWPVVEVLQQCLDRSIRIRGQLDVRDTRDPDGWRFRRWVSGGLTSVKEAQDAQLRHLRNSVDWEEVSRTQNQLIDEYLEVIRQGGLLRLSRRLWDHGNSWAKARPQKAMLESIKTVSADDISVPLGQTIALRLTRTRVDVLARKAENVARMDQLAVLMLSMCRHRMWAGRFPRTLSEISDQAAVMDPTTGQPFVYIDELPMQFPCYGVRQQPRDLIDL